MVEAILLAATTPAAEGQIFNLGGDPVSLRETVEVLVDVAASPGGYRLVPFPPERKAIDIGDVYTDYTKITTALGWQPTTPLRDGLAHAVAFYRQHWDHYAAAE